MKIRFFALAGVFTALFTLLGWNLYRLQIEKGSSYLEKVEAREERIAHRDLRRGRIFFTDRNAQAIPVALNKDFPFIYASPKDIISDADAAAAISPLVGKSFDDLQEAFSNKNRAYYPLARKATKELAATVEDLGIKGIYVDDQQYRYYPYEMLGSQMLGFVGLNDENEEPVGLYGIEKLHNESLAAGGEVHLTVDRILQAESERALGSLIAKHNASGGALIIEEPSTGKILALASKPDFNPNSYGEYPIKNFIDGAVQGMYEPGSVFKPLTMVAGIDSGALTPTTTYNDTGSVTLNGKTITNWDQRAHGKITMTNVIEESVNTGAIFAERTVGHEKFLEYLKKFGLGELTGIDLPDEIRGTLRSIESSDARAIDFATASYGQGPAATPIQIVNAFSSIANGGLLMRPYVDAAKEPYVVRRVMKQDTAKKVTAMMESAVEKGKLASIPEYRIAGKTGTAYVPENGKYVEGLFIHSYIGFFPVEKPRVAILIKLDKPDKVLAGQTVVPMFKELAQFVMNYYNLPPDKLSRMATSTPTNN